MMAKAHKFIEPRASTPAPGAEQVRTTGRLPDDMVDEQVQRLAVFSAVGAGLWALTVVVHAFITPRTVGTVIPGRAIAIEALGVVTSVAVFLYVKYAPHTCHKKTDAGLWFMVLNTILNAMLTTWVTAPTVETMGRLSWTTIIILISAMIVPSSPRKMLAASLVAASMEPLGVWIAHLRGLPVPSVVNTFVLLLPNYICAVVATLPSHVLQRVGRRLREAQELGSYQLVELLGRGGMGEVWRAEHRLLARAAAIKLIRPEVLGASGSNESRLVRRRFEREAQATAALSSPHTIRVFDFGVTHEGTFYYVMELLAGRDLESLVREFGPVPANRAIHLLRQVCHSLADAHARGLVHRDIKPANIYVCRLGLEYDFVKVLDFGLVKFNDKGASTPQETMLTANNTTTGTPAFMAPEVILGQNDVDRRADVYALGCVAYYLLTGQFVFDADTPMKMFLQHVQTMPTPPSQRTELRIPRELDDLIMACLEKDPNKRPQDAERLFEMACRCGPNDVWDNAMARTWWESHLMELTGPLTVTDQRPEAVTRAVVIH
jgi:tRNA A-37 threonylcarbamoyl transferase component Bud32